MKKKYSWRNSSSVFLWCSTILLNGANKPELLYLETQQKDMVPSNGSILTKSENKAKRYITEITCINHEKNELPDNIHCTSGQNYLVSLADSAKVTVAMI